MPLSTAAKIGLAVAGVTVVGASVYALTRDDAEPGPLQPPTPKQIPEATFDLHAAFYERTGVDIGKTPPFTVGVRYLMPFGGEEKAALIGKSRRIATIAIGRRNPSGRPDTKSFTPGLGSFEVNEFGLTVGFRAETQTLYALASKPGQYGFAMKDQNGDEFYDDLEFTAVAPA